MILFKATYKEIEGDSNISLWSIKIRIEQVSSIHTVVARLVERVS